MCRLLGIVAEHPTTLRDCLRQTPRSLGWLSREHSHGWGIALYGAGNAWRVHKNAARSGVDPRLNEIAHHVVARRYRPNRRDDLRPTADCCHPSSQ